MKSLEKFGSNIREIRNRKNLSQDKLAEITGLHRTYIGGIERGERNVSFMNILKIAQALKVDVKNLFNDLG